MRRHRALRLAAVLSLLALLIATPARADAPASAPAAGTWTLTGSMTTTRMNHTATLLPSGRVLVVGGQPTQVAGSQLASAELYDPGTGTWSPTGSIAVARMAHTTILLPDGRVLISGGWNRFNIAVASAELYHPATGTWTAAAPMRVGRESHTATVLPDGRVLVAGGLDASCQPFASAEVYDPSTNTWTPTGSMGVPRAGHGAMLLASGKVLVVSGSTTGCHGDMLTSAELYDPATGAWTPTGSVSAGRYGVAATLVADGRALVAGGLICCPYSEVSGAELYDPGTGLWTPTGSMTTIRGGHGLVRLRDGRVLAVGGSAGVQPYNVPLDSAEVYDPSTGAWSPVGSMAVHRSVPTATLLRDGRVLVAGGCDCPWGSGTVVASAELFVQPPAMPTNLRLVTVTGSSIEVRWDDPATNESHFRIAYRPAGGAWSVTAVGPNQTAWTLGNLASGVTFTFVVRSCNDAGCSDWSNAVTGTTLAATARR